jgi:hypothetical protein
MYAGLELRWASVGGGRCRGQYVQGMLLHAPRCSVDNALCKASEGSTQADMTQLIPPQPILFVQSTHAKQPSPARLDPAQPNPTQANPSQHAMPHTPSPVFPNQSQVSPTLPHAHPCGMQCPTHSTPRSLPSATHLGQSRVGPWARLLAAGRWGNSMQSGSCHSQQSPQSTARDVSKRRKVGGWVGGTLSVTSRSTLTTPAATASSQCCCCHTGCLSYVADTNAALATTSTSTSTGTITSADYASAAVSPRP